MEITVYHITVFNSDEGIFSEGMFTDYDLVDEKLDSLREDFGFDEDDDEGDTDGGYMVIDVHEETLSID